MGSSLWKYDNWRSLVKRGQSKAPSYQLSRAASCISSIKILLQGQGKYNGITQNGQQIGSCIREQVGRNTFPEAQQCGIGNLAMVSRPKNLDQIGIFTWDSESMGRLGVSPCPRSERLDVTEGFGEITIPASPMQRGSFCESDKSPVTSVLELETRPSLPGDRCVLEELERVPRLCISPILPCREMRSPVYSTGGENSINSTNLEESVLVSPASVLPIQSPGTSTVSPGPIIQPGRSKSSTLRPTVACTSSLANIRQREGNTGISEEAINVMGHAIRPRTKSVYKSAWSAYVRWCGERSVDPFQESVPVLLDYLTHLLQTRKLCYRSINVHRSAVSYHVQTATTAPLGSHPLVRKFMKGVFNLKPPQPRHIDVWDVSILVAHLASLAEASELNLKMLTLKLVTLLALSNADRASDITSLDLTGLSYLPEGALFKQINLTKTSRPGLMPDAFYPTYIHDPKLCVVTHLKEYISRTESLRSSSSLVISYVKPHGKVSAPTVSRWMVSMMSKAGLDTEKYKAHSTRAASTTKAAERGVSFAQLQKCANWTNETTFQKFYYRPRMSSSFANSVLSL